MTSDTLFWKTRLGTTGRNHEEARCVFVQSHSFGDLLLTMALLDGQSFSKNAALMLTDRLYHTNKDKLAVSTHRYDSLADVVSLVEARKADLVFFVSAYGLLDERFQPLASLETVVRRLGELGCRLVTTDPILGVSQELSAARVDLPLNLLKWRSRLRERRNLRRIFRSFAGIARTFRDITHLYPVPTDGLPVEGGVRRVSFFNPRVVRPLGESSGHDVASPAATNRHAEPSWLFVLGASDLKCQLMLWGKDHFASLVQGWLQQARSEGRRPVLIAPPPLVEILARRLPATIEARLVPFCCYSQFISLLLDAEYVFYWNTFSCSILLRLANGLPVFFFDPGHIPRLLNRSYEVGIRCYYGGVRPKVLDARRALDGRALADLVARERQDMDAILAYWRRSPTPAEVIDQLMCEPRRERGP